MAGPLIAGAPERIAGTLRQSNYRRDLPRAAFAKRAARIMPAINGAQPFHEGNGRPQRAFIRGSLAEIRRALRGFGELVVQGAQSTPRRQGVMAVRTQRRNQSLRALRALR